MVITKKFSLEDPKGVKVTLDDEMVRALAWALNDTNPESDDDNDRDFIQIMDPLFRAVIRWYDRIALRSAFLENFSREPSEEELRRALSVYLAEESGDRPLTVQLRNAVIKAEQIGHKEVKNREENP